MAATKKADDNYDNYPYGVRFAKAVAAGEDPPLSPAEEAAAAERQKVARAAKK